MHRHVDGQLVAQTRFLPHVWPDETRRVTEFQSLVRECVGPHCPWAGRGRGAGPEDLAGAPPAGNGAPVAELVLTWGPEARDLDLHLQCEDHDIHVFHGGRGQRTEHQYAQLLNDDTDGNGREVLQVEQLLEGDYHVEVVNYSGSGSLEGCRAGYHCRRLDSQLRPAYGLGRRTGVAARHSAEGTGRRAAPDYGLVADRQAPTPWSR